MAMAGFMAAIASAGFGSPRIAVAVPVPSMKFTVRWRRIHGVVMVRT
jgi:hypothetical protein